MRGGLPCFLPKPSNAKSDHGRISLNKNKCITMANVWLHFMLLLCFTISAHLLQLTDFKVFPEKGTAGVFLLSSIPKAYALNASAARDMCQLMGMTLANQAHVQDANAHGLETCRYGWIEERIAVIPRITSSIICGRGGIGVLIWRAEANRSFDAFCFNGTDLKVHLASPTADISQRRGSSSTPLSFHPSPPRIPHSTSLTPNASTPLFIPSAYLSTSIPGCTDMAQMPTMSSDKPSDVFLAVVILIITAALLMLVSGLFYCRRKRSWSQFCKRDLQRENKDTEELKPSGKQDAGGDQVEFEVDGNSNDISLSVVPDMEPCHPDGSTIYNGKFQEQRK
ncbi:lymphatic vessel endothelial hyaluronic acid receptor 1a [Brienomyrus brachyistius]|uniref:lymphatic vessel endothelial hyaluronic acid receptor 1a n=1 Tax=Brienomyrus brachyistius TaxID=42636 RepID=UPI0020B3B682|nr:lymphatic vessel endothelial hyaluronic acid receptor 1a [Brienomyrus brachyistius]